MQWLFCNVIGYATYLYTVPQAKQRRFEGIKPHMQRGYCEYKIEYEQGQI